MWYFEQRKKLSIQEHANWKTKANLGKREKKRGGSLADKSELQEERALESMPFKPPLSCRLACLPLNAYVTLCGELIYWGTNIRSKESERRRATCVLVFSPYPLPSTNSQPLSPRLTFSWLAPALVVVLRCCGYQPCFSDAHPHTCTHRVQHLPATTGAWRVRTTLCLSQGTVTCVPFLAH